MSRRLKLIVAYDGAPFAGWQSQSHRNTVQDHLERAFRTINGARVQVHGAGRTDSGVHALAQCAHADVGNERLQPARWVAALNGQLPPQLRVLRCQFAAKDFHARFSAVGKVYRYRIWTGSVLPPLEYGRVWHLPADLALDRLRSAAAEFLGRHDFKQFAANRGHRVTDTVRTIRALAVRRHGHVLTLEFDGDGFLYKMVRLIVGALAECAGGKIAIGDLRNRLSGKTVEQSSRLAAPAGGLYLVRVRY
ncbi:MAG: tRNA pseudouridine38-40 synthase [Verrucomicrobiota bacterium]|jgi:tRNA pseudouridine38-40 synthase